MTLDEAIAALGPDRHVRVRTKAGVEYDVAYDVLESAKINGCGDVDDYVYGHRVKAGGSFRRRIPAGVVRWFRLAHVEPVPR